MENNNLRIWSQVDKTDPDITKAFTGKGGFKGTSINPTYLMRKATEVFGPVGQGWGWVVLESRFDDGAPISMPSAKTPDAPLIMSKLHTVHVELWWIDETGKRCVVQQYGHTPYIYLEGGVIKNDLEVNKKSLTDAIGKCLQPLGFSADIYMGLWEDKGYVDELKAEAAITKAEDKEEEHARQIKERFESQKGNVETLARSATLNELGKLYNALAREAKTRIDAANSLPPSEHRDARIKLEERYVRKLLDVYTEVSERLKPSEKESAKTAKTAKRASKTDEQEVAQ